MYKCSNDLQVKFNEAIASKVCNSTASTVYLTRNGKQRAMRRCSFLNSQSNKINKKEQCKASNVYLSLSHINRFSFYQMRECHSNRII